MSTDSVAAAHSSDPHPTPLDARTTIAEAAIAEAAIAEAAIAEATVRDLFQSLLDAWGRGDGRAYGALFTEDADYVAFDGSRYRGEDVIAETHQQLFDTWLKGTRLVGTVESVRLLTSEVALLHATGGTIFPGQHDNRGRRPSIQTLVAVKRGAGWRFEAFHNTRIVTRNKLQWILYGIFSPIFDR